jgi:F-type H+-transporting ATPase subunit gamma
MFIFMASSVQQGAAAFQQQQRGMATLKIIALRLKSVKNIQKITQSMKMVSAAKYTRAEKDLRSAKPYGEGAQSFYKVSFLSIALFGA